MPLRGGGLRQVLAREELRMHPHDEDLLVVGAVEDADLAALRKRSLITPQEIVVEVLAGKAP